LFGLYADAVIGGVDVGVIVVVVVVVIVGDVVIIGVIIVFFVGDIRSLRLGNLVSGKRKDKIGEFGGIDGVIRIVEGTIVGGHFRKGVIKIIGV
jgi:hypothetical protein